MKGKARLLADLFWSFFKFGCFTFGGGWSILAQMQKEFSEKRQNITNEELLDLTSIARSLPGTMIGNVAMLYGYRVAGYPGGFIAVLGLILPPLLILSVIAFFYEAFQSNTLVQSAMNGIRASVVPIIMTAGFKMIKGAYGHPLTYVITAGCLVLFLKYSVSCVYLVLIGLAAGLLIGRLQRHGNVSGEDGAL